MQPGIDENGKEVPSTLSQVVWHAISEFSAVLGATDAAGLKLIQEALELRHRLPKVWARLANGEVLAWRVRRIAETTVGRPDDVGQTLTITLPRWRTRSG